MVYAIGLDLVEIERIRTAHRRYGDRFMTRLFSADEIKIIENKGAIAIESMAGRFAAKEAVLKALGVFFKKGVYLHNIEILNHPGGMPYVRLPDKLNRKLKNRKLLISITHERKFAAATAIISDED